MAIHYKQEPHTNFQAWNESQVNQAINSNKKQSKGRKPKQNTVKKKLSLPWKTLILEL